jgi:hypothetical protein
MEARESETIPIRFPNAAGKPSVGDFATELLQYWVLGNYHPIQSELSGRKILLYTKRIASCDAYIVEGSSHSQHFASAPRGNVHRDLVRGNTSPPCLAYYHQIHETWPSGAGFVSRGLDTDRGTRGLQRGYVPDHAETEG